MIRPRHFACILAALSATEGFGQGLGLANGSEIVEPTCESVTARRASGERLTPELGRFLLACFSNPNQVWDGVWEGFQASQPPPTFLQSPNIIWEEYLTDSGEITG